MAADECARRDRCVEKSGCGGHGEARRPNEEEGEGEMTRMRMIMIMVKMKMKRRVKAKVKLKVKLKTKRKTKTKAPREMMRVMMLIKDAGQGEEGREEGSRRDEICTTGTPSWAERRLQREIRYDAMMPVEIFMDGEV
ncbi:unnamed protein product [Diplocarpon coronariae]